MLIFLPLCCMWFACGSAHVWVAHMCTRMWRSAAGSGCLPRLLSARYIGLSHLTPCLHGKNSTHLSCLPAPRLHPLPVWLFSSSGYCRQSQRRFLKHLHAVHMLEPGITQVTDLFSFLYLKVWWFFFSEKCLYKHFCKLIPKKKWPSGVWMLSS